MDGQPIDYEGFAALGIRFAPGVLNQTKLNLHELRCTEQHDAVGAGWVEDVCTSGWCRTCPFAVSEPKRPGAHHSDTAPEQPKPAPVLPAPPPGDYRKRLRQVRAAIADRHLLQLDVSAGIGRALSSTKAVLSGSKPSERILDEITRYLAIAHPAARR